MNNKNNLRIHEHRRILIPIHNEINRTIKEYNKIVPNNAIGFSDFHNIALYEYLKKIETAGTNQIMEDHKKLLSYTAGLVATGLEKEYKKELQK